MPYIPSDRRRDLSDIFDTPETAGELNYIITDMLVNYLNHKGLSYQTMNDIIGALDGAKMEFYRRIVIPYENEKIEENGDVYFYRGNTDEKL
jgi:hypothetical protein